MIAPRGAAAIRTAVGLVGAAGILAGAAALPDLDVRPVAGPSRASSTPVTDAEFLCPGTELTGIDDVPDVSTSVRVVAGTAPAAVLGVDPPASTGAVTLAVASGPTVPDAADGERTTQRGAVVTTTASEDGVVRAAGSGGLAPALLAAQESDPREDQVAGLASTACPAPAAESWLTGGSAEPGRQERLLLLNPGANPVTVDIAVAGRRGPIVTGAATGVVVPARSRHSVLLDALAPDEAAPFFHVTTRGGFVGAVLADHWLDGVTPRGFADVPGLAAPATEQVIPAVTGPGSVRLHAPGEQDAVVEVRLLTPDGPSALPDGAGVLRVPAGTTAEVPLTKLPSGVSALQIRSDEPVVAAAQLTPVKARDFAWAPASALIRGLAGAVYPALDSAADRTRTLALASTGGRARVGVTTVADGRAQTRELSIADDATLTLDLSLSDAVWVRRVAGNGDVRAALLTTGGSGAKAVIDARPLTAARISVTTEPVEPVGPLG